MVSAHTKPPSTNSTLLSNDTHRVEWRTLFQLLRYTAVYKHRLFWALSSSILVSLFSVVSITMLLPIVETVFQEERYQPGDNLLGHVLAPVYALINTYASDNALLTLGVICAVFFGLSIITGLFRYLQQYMVYWLGNRVVVDMQHELFEHLSRFNAAYFAQQHTGSLVSLFTVDIRAVGTSIFRVFGQILLDPLLLFFTFLWLLSIQWQLTLIYTFIFPAVFFSLRYFAKKNRSAGHDAQTIMAQLGSVLQEHFSHIRTVQAYGMEAHQYQKFRHESMGVFRAMMRMLKAIAASSPVNHVLGVVGFCIVLMVGATFILAQPAEPNTMQPAEFVVFLALLASVYQPTKRLERAFQEIQLGLAAADRVFAELDSDKTLPLPKHPMILDKFNRDIQFESVHFAYEANAPVLQDIGITVEKGEQIALVGPSGAGKTTLVNLLPRFYDPSEGCVKIDGTDVRQLDLSSLRRAISVVPQEVALFHDRVWTNLTCGDERYTEEQVMAAARAAYADGFIRQLPQGYNTVLGEHGASLSGGQRQRLALARAFLRDAPILILDEATSALDSESERHIQQSMKNLLSGRTAFIIAHRLSTVLHADRILVLDQGKQVDFGTHNQLLARCSLYARLHALQFNPQSPQLSI